MPRFTRFFILCSLLCALCRPVISMAATWHLVFIRHAEKPSAGLGQLNCTGLQRALRLPEALLKLSPPPQRLIVPDPGIYKMDHGHSYAYVRPLATLEPAAVRFALPLEAHLGYADVKGLVAQLQQLPDHSVVWIAWEHHYLIDTERELMHQWQQSIIIPDWPDQEYDRVDLIDVTQTPAGWQVVFHQAQEQLNHLPNVCPEE